MASLENGSLLLLCHLLAIPLMVSLVPLSIIELVPLPCVASRYPLSIQFDLPCFFFLFFFSLFRGH
jgi:hypothetical protein